MARNATAVTVVARGPGRPRSEKARKAVIRSTLALLKRTGFHELSVEAVAAHAAVSKATVYRWWANKGELVIDEFVSDVEKEISLPITGRFLAYSHYHLLR